jgi:hypothetical protein
VPQPRPPFVRPRSTICKKPVVRPSNGFPKNRSLRWTATGLTWGTPHSVIRPAEAGCRTEPRSRPLEILHSPLMFLRRRPRRKRSQVLPFPRLCILLAGIQTILAGCSLRIIEKRMLCLYRSVGKEKDAGQLSSCAVEEPLSRRCSERPRTEIPHAASLQNLSSWARNTSPPMMHHPKQLRLISRLGTPDAQTNASTPRYF